MQFFILFIGAMVFVVFLFVRPPLVFQPVVMEQVQASPQYAAIEGRYEQAFDQRQAAAHRNRIVSPWRTPGRFARHRPIWTPRVPMRSS